jgi:threonine synthase
VSTSSVNSSPEPAAGSAAKPAAGSAARPAAGSAAARPRLVERYREFLPITDATPIISLGEGFTPLIRIDHIGKRIGIPNLYVKYEGMNPTGSFKDRGMVMAISKAVEEGAQAVICASTGNTSASAAAYGAAAALEVIVVLPKGKIALGKLIQAIAAGAKVVAVDGNFDQALRVVREMAEMRDHPVTLVNSVNPYRIAGQTTAAFEVCDDLGRAPDILAIPVGNAGNITAYWAGFNRYAQAGRIAAKPRMFGFQAAGAAPIVLGHAVEHPETIATAIRIGNPASWKQAEAARDESGGLIETVTDDEIVAAYRDLATSQGIFCEPASAASLAGVCKLAAAGRIDADATVVCVLTGHGLKDPETAERTAGGAGAIIEAAPTTDGVMRALGW